MNIMDYGLSLLCHRIS